MTDGLKALLPLFVEFVPKTLEPGVLYVSMEFATTAHLCACGCGEKVILPLHPTDWHLTYNGKAITLRPSVGNWGFPCQSHYLITSNRVEWSDYWDDTQIAVGRSRDKARRDKFFTDKEGARIEMEVLPTIKDEVFERPRLISRILKALKIGK